jgi:hypothetical protein
VVLQDSRLRYNVCCYNPVKKEETNMKKHLIVGFCALFMFVALGGATQAANTGFGFGGGRDLVGNRSLERSGPSQVRAEITGTVQKTRAGLAINAVDGLYLVSGQDLSSMVQKKVIASGEVSQSRGKKTIFVTSFRELK